MGIASSCSEPDFCFSTTSSSLEDAGEPALPGLIGPEAAIGAALMLEVVDGEAADESIFIPFAPFC